MGASSSCLVASVSPLSPLQGTESEAGVRDKLVQSPGLLSKPVAGLRVLLGGGAQTWLHVACERVQLQVVQQMFEFLSASDTPIVREALKPYCRRMGIPLPGCVREGVRLAASMCNSNGQTPIMLACAACCPDLAKFLLEQGASVWAVDLCGCRTALHYAAISGSADCVAALLESVPSGAWFINARCLRGLTALHYAILHGHHEVLRELLRHDPDLNVATSAAGNCSYYSGPKDPWVSGLEECEPHSTPLHLAAARGDAVAVRELLLHFASREGFGRHATATSTADPRLTRTASGRQPWQLALPRYPELGRELVVALHPSQPLPPSILAGVGGSTAATPAVPIRATGTGSSSNGDSNYQADAGPPSLAAIAAAALKQKLLASLAAVEVAERKAAAEAEAARVLTSAPVPPRRHLSGCRTMDSSSSSSAAAAAAAAAAATVASRGSRRAATVTGYYVSAAGQAERDLLDESSRFRCASLRGMIPAAGPPLPPSSSAMPRPSMPSALQAPTISGFFVTPLDAGTLDSPFLTAATSEPHPFGVLGEESLILEPGYSSGAANSNVSFCSCSGPACVTLYRPETDTTAAAASAATPASCGTARSYLPAAAAGLPSGMPEVTAYGSSCCPQTPTTAGRMRLSVTGVTLGFEPLASNETLPCTMWQPCGSKRIPSPGPSGGSGRGTGKGRGQASLRILNMLEDEIEDDVGMQQKDVDDDAEDDGICSVCFARPEAAAPATCHHGICSVCAGELCRAVSSRPLLCPFCRQPVTDFVRVAAPAGGAAGGRRGKERVLEL